MTSGKTRFLALTGALLGGAMFVMAQKVDDNNIFELDGNALASTTDKDWANSISSAPISSAVISGVAAKADAASASIFTQGGSKDINGINQWRYTNGAVPDKDDITDAFAIAKNAGSDLLVYFGADRYANNGDANIGFWFFKKDVSPGANGKFNGHHSDGDVFVVSGFTSGGLTTEIDVYKWSCPGDDGDACDNNGSLVLITSTVGGGTCTPTTGGAHVACAIANSAPTPAPWFYTPKTGSTGTFPIATFFEGGVNVGPGGLNLGTGLCFASFLVETRSSTSLSAQLKDFTQGGFENCSGGLTKECTLSTSNHGLNGDGTAFVYNFGGVVHNTGGTLFDVTVTDVFAAGVVTGTISPAGSGGGSCVPGPGTNEITCKYNVGGMTTGQCKAWPNGELVDCNNPHALETFGTFQSTINGGDLDHATLAAATTLGGAQVPLVTDPVTASCPGSSASGQISVTKSCTTDIGATPNFSSIAVTVNFSGTVCNQSATTDLTNITAKDIQFKKSDNSQIGSEVVVTFDGASPVNLAACAAGAGNCTDEPASCRTYSGSYSPTAASGPDIDGTVATYVFDDKVTATGHFPAILDTVNHTGEVTNSKTAECPLCLH